MEKYTVQISLVAALAGGLISYFLGGDPIFSAILIGLLVYVSILRVNRKKCMLILVPKVYPKCCKFEESTWGKSFMFFDSFFGKYSEIPFNLIAGWCYLMNIVSISLKHIWKSIFYMVYSFS